MSNTSHSIDGTSELLHRIIRSMPPASSNDHYRRAVRLLVAVRFECGKELRPIEKGIIEILQLEIRIAVTQVALYRALPLHPAINCEGNRPEESLHGSIASDDNSAVVEATVDLVHAVRPRIATWSQPGVGMIPFALCHEGFAFVWVVAFCDCRVSLTIQCCDAVRSLPRTTCRKERARSRATRYPTAP